MQKRVRIAIVGGGPAGLCCARHLIKYPEYFQVHVMEQNATIGGTWVYSSNTTPQPYQKHVHSSIHKNLRTNTTKEVMAFPDFPFSTNLTSYISHYDVHEYLKQYASHFKLNQVIKLGTYVERIVPIPITESETDNHVSVGNSIQQNDKATTTGEPSFKNWGQFRDTVKWRITSLDVKSGERTSDDYDAVLVCNGHFFEPYIPTIPGLSKFPGHTIHSHIYREPEEYKDQEILIIGGGMSGQDIMVDICPYAKKVYLVNRGPPLVYSLPDNIEELPALSEIGEDGIVYFINGKERHIDSIIIATGYQYSLPFLTDDSGIRIEGGKRVVPLYNHTFNPLHPSMVFMGINSHYNPFPYFDFVVRWVILVWAGDKTLPSTEDMIKEDEEIYQERLKQGLSPHIAAHGLGPIQWEMLDSIAERGDMKKLDPAIKSLYDEIDRERRTNYIEFRKKNYTILNKYKWKEETS